MGHWIELKDEITHHGMRVGAVCQAYVEGGLVTETDAPEVLTIAGDPSGEPLDLAYIGTDTFRHEIERWLAIEHNASARDAFFDEEGP